VILMSASGASDDALWVDRTKPGTGNRRIDEVLGGWQIAKPIPELSAFGGRRQVAKALVSSISHAPQMPARSYASRVTNGENVMPPNGCSL